MIDKFSWKRTHTYKEEHRNIQNRQINHIIFHSFTGNEIYCNQSQSINFLKYQRKFIRI